MTTISKKLKKGYHRQAGRNARGLITCRHHGGGHKKLYRKVTFRCSAPRQQNRYAFVSNIIYDPNRSAFLALLVYANGEQASMLHPESLKKGDLVLASRYAPNIIGNSLPLAAIPFGLPIHNIELFPGKGGQLVRSAGSRAFLVGRESGSDYVTLKLPSNQVYSVLKTCWATLGGVSNKKYALRLSRKAGQSRWKGRRPTVRGSAMNPVDHPHGGGEGRSPIGHPHPLTPWGKIARGVKTAPRSR